MDLDNTPHAKFVKHQGVIRDRASLDENNYASTCVRAMDKFTMGQVYLNIYKDKSNLFEPNSLEVQSIENKIVEQFAISLSASEVFTIILPDVYHQLKSLSSKLLTREGGTTEHDARIVYGFLLSNSDPKATIKFLDESRKKFPDEIFFHRGYCHLIKNSVDGLKAVEEVYKLFPQNPDILHDRAVRMMKVVTDDGTYMSYNPSKNWLQHKKKIEPVMKAFKEFFKFAPRDHRQFATNHFAMAYLSLKYAQPAAQLMGEDLQEIVNHFQNGLRAEEEILPCFLPLDSSLKNCVEKVIKIGPTTHVDVISPLIPSGKGEIEDKGKPDRRRTDICVAHRKKLKEFQDNPVFERAANLQPLDNPEKVDEEDLSQKFKDICLSEMNKSGKDTNYPFRIITLTVVEDPYYSQSSGSLEMVAIDQEMDVVNLHLDVSGGDDDPRILMRKFQFGSKWTIKIPHFEGDINAEDGFIRAGHGDLIKVGEGKQPGRCRYCWKFLDPGQHCSKCRRSSYCGKECQKKDWKYLKHGLICCENFNDFYN